MVETTDLPREHTLRARIREFDIPPIRDGVIIGRKSPIGTEAMQSALRFLCSDAFTVIQTKDSAAIECIIVRSTVSKKVSEDKLIEFVSNHIEPIMNDTEILLLEMQFEFVVEAYV